MSTQKIVLEMVRNGPTKSDIMNKYNLTPYQYRRMTESFPKTVREELRTLLIGNGHKTRGVKKEKATSAVNGATYVIKRGKTNVTVEKTLK